MEKNSKTKNTPNDGLWSNQRIVFILSGFFNLFSYTQKRGTEPTRMNKSGFIRVGGRGQDQAKDQARQKFQSMRKRKTTAKLLFRSIQ